MPALVVCSTCQTKLKIPENSSAKALRCPKCKGIVPIARPDSQAAPVRKTEQSLKPMVPPPPAEEEELEVNEPADEEELEVNEPADEEELEVNEPADEDEELEVNEAEDEDDEQEAATDEDSPLGQLGFANVKNPYKKAGIPDEARKAFERSFLKKEKTLWAGKPNAQLIESKAWIGLVVGPIAILVGLTVCLSTSSLAIWVIEEMPARIVAPAVGAVFGLIFSLVGILAIVFRKRIGGDAKACYIVTNKRAYIYDGNTKNVRAFTPAQIFNMKCLQSAKFEDAGDLVFKYDLQGQTGVEVGEELKDRYGGGVAVGFLNIDQVHLVRRMIQEVLIEPALAKAKEKKKKRTKKPRPYWNQ
jgi:hypothetical protein